MPARGPPESIVLLTAPITDSLEKSPFPKVPFVKKMQQHEKAQKQEQQQTQHRSTKRGKEEL